MNETAEKKNALYPLICILLSAALALCALLDCFAASEQVRGDCLRLHIIASSDSPEDQSVKLKVRDALLAEGAAVFDGETDAHNAVNKITPYIPFLKKTADRVLKENGCTYTSEIKIAEEYFDTREYDGITLPAGRYTAFKVILGEGKGKNWWCVMFPPLCLPAVTKDRDSELYAVFGSDGARLVKGKREYKVRFKIVEVIEKLIEDMSEK